MQKALFEAGGIFLLRHEAVLLSAFRATSLLPFSRGATGVQIRDVGEPGKREQEHRQSISRSGWEELANFKAECSDKADAKLRGHNSFKAIFLFFLLFFFFFSPDNSEFAAVVFDITSMA